MRSYPPSLRKFVPLVFVSDCVTNAIPPDTLAFRTIAFKGDAVRAHSRKEIKANPRKGNHAAGNAYRWHQDNSLSISRPTRID